MRFLCISDIHGHADALAAVLATAERRGYDKILAAGDLLFPGPTPKETWWRLTQAGAMCVQGIGDRALATLDVEEVRARSEHEQARLDRLHQTRRELGDLVLERLARMPRTARLPLPNGGELLLVHGSPLDPTEPICHEMSDEEVSALLGDDPADIVVCGGSHVPFQRVLSTGVLGPDGRPHRLSAGYPSGQCGIGRRGVERRATRRAFIAADHARGCYIYRSFRI